MQSEESALIERDPVQMPDTTDCRPKARYIEASMALTESNKKTMPKDDALYPFTTTLNNNKPYDTPDV